MVGNDFNESLKQLRSCADKLQSDCQSYLEQNRNGKEATMSVRGFSTNVDGDEHQDMPKSPGHTYGAGRNMDVQVQPQTIIDDAYNVAMGLKNVLVQHTNNLSHLSSAPLSSPSARPGESDISPSYFQSPC